MIVTERLGVEGADSAGERSQKLSLITVAKVNIEPFTLSSRLSLNEKFVRSGAEG